MSKNLSILSAGNHFIKNILPVLKKNRTIKISGVFTRNLERRRKISSDLGCNSYNSLDELLRDNSENIYISSPNSEHFEQLKECLSNGKNVLVEKPAVTSSKEFLKLLEISKKNKVFFMEAFMYRFHNFFTTLKEIIDHKTYGNIKKVSINFGFPHLDNNNIRYNKNLKGGAALDAGAYTLSCSRELFGDDYLLLAKKIFKDGVISSDIDTGGNAFLDYGSFIVSCNWFFGASYQNSVRIWFEDGVLEADIFFSKPESIQPNLKIYKNYELVSSIPIKKENHFNRMFDYFFSVGSDLQKFEMERVEKNISLLEEIMSK